MEAEHVGVGLHEQPAVDGRPQQVDELGPPRVPVTAARRSNVTRGGRAPTRRSTMARTVRAELVELGAHRPRPRSTAAARRSRPSRGRSPALATQLLEEERVAAGAGVQRVDGAERRVLVEDGGRKALTSAGVRRLEVQVHDRVPALEAGQHLGGGVAAGQAVGPVGADDEQRAAVGLGQALEQREALGVGPVEVLEHHEAGTAGGEVADQVDRQPAPARRRVASDRSRPSARSGSSGRRRPRAQRVEEQLHRSSDGAGVGLPGEHDGAGGHAVDELLDQPGLADPGLAGDEGDGR